MLVQPGDKQRIVVFVTQRNTLLSQELVTQTSGDLQKNVPNGGNGLPRYSQTTPATRNDARSPRCMPRHVLRSSRIWPARFKSLDQAISGGPISSDRQHDEVISIRDPSDVIAVRFGAPDPRIGILTNCLAAVPQAVSKRNLFRSFCRPGSFPHSRRTLIDQAGDGDPAGNFASGVP